MQGLAPFLIILLGAKITFFLSPLKYCGPIRSSTLATLGFVLLTKVMPLSWPLYSDVLFFGGSFIGMSGIERLSRYSLPLSCLIFYLYFYEVGPHIKGLGGGLGLGAFLSVIPIAVVSYMLSKRHSPTEST